MELSEQNIVFIIFAFAFWISTVISFIYSIVEIILIYTIKQSTFQHGLILLRRTTSFQPQRIGNIPSKRLKLGDIRYRWISNDRFYFSSQFKFFPPSNPYKGIGTISDQVTNLEFRAPTGMFVLFGLPAICLIIAFSTVPLEHCTINGIKYPMDSEECKSIIYLMVLIFSIILGLTCALLRRAAVKAVMVFDSFARDNAANDT